MLDCPPSHQNEPSIYVRFQRGVSLMQLQQIWRTEKSLFLAGNCVAYVFEVGLKFYHKFFRSLRCVIELLASTLVYSIIRLISRNTLIKKSRGKHVVPYGGHKLTYYHYSPLGFLAKRIQIIRIVFFDLLRYLT